MYRVILFITWVLAVVGDLHGKSLSERITHSTFHTPSANEVLPWELLGTTEPVFYLKNFKVNGKEKPVTSLGSLVYDENNIEIHYGNSHTTQEISFRYRLSTDSSWVYSNVRPIRFTSLLPGLYLFQLQYSMKPDQWHEALSPLAFTISKPWWMSGYFYSTLAFIAVLVLCCIYVRYLLTRFRRKQQHLRKINAHQQKLIQTEIVTQERERNRIARELHDTVGTNLITIKLMVNQILINHKEPLASDVEKQFQLALKEIREIIYKLTPPSLERYGLFTALKSYIEELNRNIPFNISLQTFGQEVNSYEFNLIVFRVLQELLSISIRHSSAETVNIHLNSFDDLLNIVYEDEGIPSSLASEAGETTFNNIESKVKSINGVMKFDSGNFGISYNIDIPLTFKPQIA